MQQWEETSPQGKISNRYATDFAKFESEKNIFHLGLEISIKHIPFPTIM